LFLFAALVTTGINAQSITLPEATGKALVIQHCAGACHEMQRIEESQGTHAEWVVRIRRMIRRGAVIPVEHIEPLAQYLAAALPPRVRSQATSGSPTTTTLGEVAPRPIQTWVRGAGAMQSDGQTIVATLPLLVAADVKVNQRVRAFSLASRSSMRQGTVSRVVVGKVNVQVTVRLGTTAPHDTYLLEIIAQQDALLSVPTEAIIEEGERQIVYVQSKAGDYQPRVIKTGVQGELYTQVTAGLVAGEQVVTFGSFFIDAEYKMKSASKAPASEGNALAIDYRSNPDPPSAGDNSVRVTVKQANGAPATDVDVSLTYYMPAMPAMNMPEMRDVFPLVNQGAGVYGGKARFSMAGTWIVTISVTQSGQPVGQKVLTIIAK
jgi:hypothetical protein